MKERTRFENSVLRSIKFDSLYLQEVNTFLSEEFKRVLYVLKTDKHPYGNRNNYEETLKYIDNLRDEKIKEIVVYCFKHENTETSYGSGDLQVNFSKGNILPNIYYSYADGHRNEDVGFLETLNKFLKRNRFWYAFLFDDGIGPSSLKYLINILVTYSLSVSLAYFFLHINSTTKSDLASGQIFLSSLYLLFIFNLVLSYLLPRLTFVLTEKERFQRSFYVYLLKAIFWLGGGLFFMAVGIIVERFFL